MRGPAARRLTIPRVLAVGSDVLAASSRLVVAGVLGVLAACPDDAEPGPPEDCPALVGEAECDAGTGCVWDPQGLECVVDCAAIDERATCNDQDACFWNDDVCHFGVL